MFVEGVGACSKSALYRGRLCSSKGGGACAMAQWPVQVMYLMTAAVSNT